MKLTVASSPHIRGNFRTNRIMLDVVIALGGLITFIMYPFVKGQIRKDTALYRLLRRMGARTHWQDTRFWATMQKWMDR